MRGLMVFVCVVLFSYLSWAETVQLKTGEIHQGTIVESNDEYVAISMGGAPIYLPQEQINQITNEVLPSEPVANDSQPQTAVEQASHGAPQTVSQGGPSSEHHSKDLKCSFIIPAGFSVVEDAGDKIILRKADGSVDIMILRIISEKPVNNENIKVIGLQLVADSLNLEASDLQGIGKIVKLFGDRIIAGKKGYWFYYPEINTEFFIYRAFVSGNDGTGYMLHFNIYHQNNDQYVEQGDKLANAFLDGFKI